jgi:hypothetical protein
MSYLRVKTKGREISANKVQCLVQHLPEGLCLPGRHVNISPGGTVALGAPTILLRKRARHCRELSIQFGMLDYVSNKGPVQARNRDSIIDGGATVRDP